MASNVTTAINRVRGAQRQLARAAGSNFYYSFLMLPSAKRKAIKDVYAFCRLLDDIVDEDPAGRDPAALIKYERARECSNFISSMKGALY